MSEPPVLGVPPMDGEHSFQITLLRVLKKAAGRADKKEALELIGQLDDLTNMHFLFEETLMIRRGYPEHEAHRREHGRLIEELRRLRQAVASLQEETSLKEAAEIERWLLHHIQTFDRALAAFIKPAGPAAE